MKTKEQLTSEKNELIQKLNKTFDSTADTEILAQLKANETELAELNKMELLRQVNAKYSRLRDMAKLAWDCEQPTEDITTNDCSFHKTKVKKYPNIAALQYASAKWQDNRITEIRINGERFSMFRVKYGYNKPNEYTRPETLAEFLQLNSIPETEITIQQYNDICSKLQELNAQIDADIKKYNEGLESLKIHTLSHWGLVGQNNTNLYKYSPNRG